MSGLVKLEKPALVLRTCDKNRKSHAGFEWPESGHVEAPDWEATDECGAGLHGLLWGRGNYGLMSSSADALWFVAEVTEYIDLDGKIKFPFANVIYCGTSAGALGVLRGANWGCEKTVEPTTGNRAHSSTTGDDAHSSTTGNDAHSSTTGNRAHSSTTGNRAHSSTTGDGAHSSTTGYRAHSSTTGNDSIACALGEKSRVKAGDAGALVLRWYDEAAERVRVSVAYPGEGGIKPGTWYELDGAGNFSEAEQ